MFLLDTRMMYLEKQGRFAMGKWLLRRWRHCEQKRMKAQRALNKLAVTEAVLRAAWAAQIEKQTKPGPSK